MIKDKLTAIVGGIVGCVILLTIFCCEGKQEAVEVIEETPAVEEVIEETPAVEEVLPAESVE